MGISASPPSQSPCEERREGHQPLQGLDVTDINSDLVGVEEREIPWEKGLAQVIAVGKCCWLPWTKRLGGGRPGPQSILSPFRPRQAIHKAGRQLPQLPLSRAAHLESLPPPPVLLASAPENPKHPEGFLPRAEVCLPAWSGSISPPPHPPGLSLLSRECQKWPTLKGCKSNQLSCSYTDPKSKKDFPRYYKCRNPRGKKYCKRC